MKHTRARTVSPDAPWLSRLRRLAAAAGMSHDFGKASINFQNKLRSAGPIADTIRHEWISLHLLDIISKDPAFQSDTITDEDAWRIWASAWETLSSYPTGNLASTKLHAFPGEAGKLAAKMNFGRAASFHEALGIAVATHHGLFQPDADDTSMGVHPLTSGHTNRQFKSDQPCAPIDGFIQMSGRWSDSDRAEMARLLRRFHSSYRVLVHQDNSSSWKGSTIISRAALILADHEVSARKIGRKAVDTPTETPATKESDAALVANSGLYANTDRSTGSLNQTLPYHLAQVGQRAHFWVGRFFDHQLPGIDAHVRHRLLHEETPGRFLWQGECTRNLLAATEDQPLPTLVLNLASTGAGKTRMNAKAVAALTPAAQPLRLAAGFNLKTLTLQTRDAFRDELGLPSHEVACLVGDRLAVALHQHPMLVDDENLGPADGQVNQEYDVVVDSTIQGLPRWLDQIASHDQAKIKSLIGAPALVSTMDYLVHAGEPGQQGHHGQALLRLATSDLIVDEADSYDPKAIAAIMRLVHASAMFGRNVVLSSATLPEIVARAMLESFRAGVLDGACVRDDQNPAFRVAILDNADTPYSAITLRAEDTSCETTFAAFYEGAVARKSMELSELETQGMAVRRYRVVSLIAAEPATRSNGEDRPVRHQAMMKAMTRQISSSAIELHSTRGWSLPAWGDKRVSFGLVRVANVPFCVELSHRMIELNGTLEDTEIYVCPYHSVDLALRRKYKETQLDLALQRKAGWKDTIATNRMVEERVKRSNASNVIFLVVATPVEEVGRDHDFDWAIIEPSSTASIIQTAGRVNRHRLNPLAPGNENIHILRHNRKALMGEMVAFNRPGMETGESKYPTHDAADLLGAENGVLDTRLRFGDSACLFSKKDEEALASALAHPKNALTISGAMGRSWVVSRFYKAFPLREKGMNTNYRVEKDDQGSYRLEQQTFNLIPGAKKGFSGHQESWSNQPHGNPLAFCRRNEYSPYWWLCPEFPETEKMVESIPSQIRHSSMRFKVGVYSENQPSTLFNVRAGGY